MLELFILVLVFGAGAGVYFYRRKQKSPKSGGSASPLDPFNDNQQQK